MASDAGLGRALDAPHAIGTLQGLAGDRPAAEVGGLAGRNFTERNRGAGRILDMWVAGSASGVQRCGNESCSTGRRLVRPPQQHTTYAPTLRCGCSALCTVHTVRVDLAVQDCVELPDSSASQCSARSGRLETTRGRAGRHASYAHPAHQPGPWVARSCTDACTPSVHLYHPCQVCRSTDRQADRQTGPPLSRFPSTTCLRAWDGQVGLYPTQHISQCRLRRRTDSVLRRLPCRQADSNQAGRPTGAQPNRQPRRSAGGQGRGMGRAPTCARMARICIISGSV
jgi:hypothetical protein